MRWQFYYSKRYTFYPPDYETPGLGGSEASLVLLTRTLASRGHSVEVFNCCYKPGVYDGVRWRMLWEREDAGKADVAVAVRFEESLCPDSARANTHLFWMLDNIAGGADLFAERFGDHGGRVVTASEAMTRRLGDGAAARLSTRIPLPIEVDRYEHADRPRDPICLFTSMPNRGLDVALKIWPAIRRAVPAAQLLVTSGWQLWGEPAGEAQGRMHRTLGGMPAPAGVSILGVLPRRDLIAVQQRGWLTLYPCRFHEMFCISAAESAAAGAPMVTSALEALTERVQHRSTGLLIPGDIDEQETQHQFAEATIGLLRDQQTRDRFATAGVRQVAACEPHRVAQQWESLVS